jgi:hypothetical protein
MDIMNTFRILSEDDIGDITLGTSFLYLIHSDMQIFPFIQGVFQLKRARSYAEEKCSTTDLTGVVNYTVQLARDYHNLILVPTQSAHSARKTHHPIIEFSADQILNWWCDCQIGNRYIGSCSHIASAVWFLSFERWQIEKRRMPSGNYINLVTDASQLSDFYDSTDDDDQS